MRRVVVWSPLSRIHIQVFQSWCSDFGICNNGLSSYITKGNLLIRPAPPGSKSPYNFEIVLLDHGLYFDIDPQLRVNYGKLWLSLIAPASSSTNADRRKYAELVGNISADLVGCNWQFLLSRTSVYWYLPDVVPSVRGCPYWSSNTWRSMGWRRRGIIDGEGVQRDRYEASVRRGNGGDPKCCDFSGGSAIVSIWCFASSATEGAHGVEAEWLDKVRLVANSVVFH